MRSAQARRRRAPPTGTPADQAVYAAGIEWIGTFAEEYDRPVLVGFSMAAVSLAGVLLGAIAPHTDAVWPVLILLVLNGFAVVAAVPVGGTVRARWCHPAGTPRPGRPGRAPSAGTAARIPARCRR